MKRRDFIALLGGAAAAWPLAARAQQQDAVRRIAVLMDTEGTNTDGQARIAAFRQGLQQLGWTEDRNIRIDLRWGGGDVERIRAYAAELVGLKPDVIFAYAVAQLAPLSRETHEIPIVFCGASAPVADGFVASFARPGGNITGFTQYEPSMVGKWLGALKEIAPAVARVAIIVNPRDGPSARHILLARIRDRRRHVPHRTAHQVRAQRRRHRSRRSRARASAQQRPDRGAGDLHDSQSRAPHRAGGTTSGPADLRHSAISSERRLDVLWPRHRRYGPARGELCGPYPARRKLADLSVQAPTKFEFVINAKTAKALASTCRRRC